MFAVCDLLSPSGAAGAGERGVVGNFCMGSSQEPPVPHPSQPDARLQPDVAASNSQPLAPAPGSPRLNRPPAGLPVLGLLGGVASGKSYVAKLLAQRGAIVLDADRAGHQVLEEPEVRQAIRARWGNRVFDAQDQVDRKAVGVIVFGDPGELEFLEAVTHPRIGRRLTEQMEQSLRQGAPAAVLDAPVMLKAGWNALCDSVWFIDAPRQLRQQRALERGWSQDQFAAREAAQESLEAKRRWADVVIDNSGSPAVTAALVDTHWNEFMERTKSRQTVHLGQPPHE